jgi:hypothetical protein
MAEGESVEGITFAGNRLIVGRQRRTADEMRPQVSWVSAPSLRKVRCLPVCSSGLPLADAHLLLQTPAAEQGQPRAVGHHRRPGSLRDGRLVPRTLPSTALTAETSLSTSVYATGGFDHAVKLWKFDDESRRKLWALHSTDHTSRVDALIWDDQKKWLYSAGADGRSGSAVGLGLADAHLC